MSNPLDSFSPAARSWFELAFDSPTEVQIQGWPEIASGHHTLLSAPTGSGKTLAAFFWCLDRLVGEPLPPASQRCRVLYVSPLKALAFDVDRNLRSPLAGLAVESAKMGAETPDVAIGLRTGDTPAAERRQMQRHPPDILITTPESLFLLLTSAARTMLDHVRWVVVDEIHTMAGSKRGAHLAISLERLCERTHVDPQRIGLSATQKPLEEVARYLGGRDRDVRIVDAGRKKTLDLSVEVGVEDMVDLDRGAHTVSGPIAPIGASRAPADIGITTEIARSRPWAAEDGEQVALEERALPRRSIWPAIYPRILELIRAHRSTIVFANSRRMAERLAAKLNELAGEELVRAHHGSIAREQRLVVEDLLKSGKLPGLIATSSLELGIDMGAVDLVIQVGSPTTVSRGIQRIGRAGHSVGEPSVGTILPTHRGDLLEAATLVERMLQGEIESTRVPRNPIDVLAQQIVAMCALDEWPAERLRELVSRAYPFAELGDRAFEATLDMLDGRYPAEDFAGLRPRIVWDRLNGTLRGRSGSQHLAVISGGTIPDRGLFTVNLLQDGKRVGELDEEMVYELRVGETFVLGATTWKTAEITQSQVRVIPAPGEPGKVSFWHGDALGRPVEVGMAVGALTRKLLAMPEEQALDHLIQECRCDHPAATNLMAYLKDQIGQTGAAPDDHTIVVERFRDQLGDWRLCVLTPFGARVHAPWALAVEARLQERFGLEIQSIYTDDGFALRLIEADSPPGAMDVMLDPEDVREVVTDQLHGSALFASRFRENAARALLLPRLRPGSRTPLWLQRQRSADLLRVASRHPDFPILAETYRECLVDVFDLDALVGLMMRVRSRDVRVVEVETAMPSPVSSSLLFDYIGQYMYEGDTPLAERRAQALTLDRELLGELLGSEDLRELLDPEAVSRTELELQGLVPDRFPRNVDEAVDLLRTIGDLADEETSARGIEQQWLLSAAGGRRVVQVRIAGQKRWIAADDAGLYRDALGTSLPMGLPDVFVQPVDEPVRRLLLRWARTHVSFRPTEPAKRWNLPVPAVEAALEELVRGGDLVAGQFRMSGEEREFCSGDVLRTLRRRSLAALRHEVEPVSQTVLSRLVPAWQGVGVTATGIDRLADIVAQLEGFPVPVSVLERDIIASRMSGYSPQLMDQLVASGEVVWIGNGQLGSNDGRVALYPRRDVHKLAVEATEGPGSDLHDSIRERLTQGAYFFTDLLAAVHWKDSEEVLDAVWDLVWAGEVTNDTFAPLRFVGPSRRTSRRGMSRIGPPRSLGRWSLVANLLQPEVAPTERAYAQVDALLHRYGLITREHVAAEGIQGGFVSVYSILRTMEEAGRIRRGYFVEGLGAAQFALPGAVDRLRALRTDGDSVLLLAAVDPACCYGVTVPWPEMEGRPSRSAGAYVILDGGELRLYIDRGGGRILTNGEVAAVHVEQLKTVAARRGKLQIRTIDGLPVQESSLRHLLLDAGFTLTHRGLVLYRERRSPAR